MALTFRQGEGGAVRLLKVENGPKVDERAQTEAVLRAFRETSANDPDDAGPGELCFRVEIKMPKRKNSTKKKTVVFVGIGDEEGFQTALRACTKLVGGDEAASVFMTDDGYGIVANQVAGNVFFKYGINVHLHVGVSLRNVSWHMRR